MILMIFHFCRANSIPILYSADVNSKSYIEYLKSLKPNLAFARINQILKKDILAIPNLKFINPHNSLLPQYRGIDGVFWGMVNNEQEFGTTIHYISEKLDSGDVIMQKAVNLQGLSLYSRENMLNTVSADLLLKTFEQLLQGKVKSRPMGDQGKSFYSFATKKGMSEFKKKGNILITLMEVKNLFSKSNQSIEFDLP